MLLSLLLLLLLLSQLFNKLLVLLRRHSLRRCLGDIGVRTDEDGIVTEHGVIPVL